MTVRIHLLTIVSCFASTAQSTLQLGTGIYDATGPISDTIMMGMANPSQYAAGLHQRLRSRAFVAYDDVTGKRFAFVSLDAGMAGLVLKNRVTAGVEQRLPGLYSDNNIGISGTHTHSGPSGFLQDVLYQFSGSGWKPQTLDAMVTGVVESIVMAHNNLTPASGKLAVGELTNSSINRSPTAYLENPVEERAKYDSDTDNNMTVFTLEAANGTELGLFTWFAVHPTSMNNTNVLVSGDNKGYASYLYEQYKNGRTNVTRPGHGKFVAAFASTNLGDVSPNTKGPHCRDTGLPCDILHSTCGGRNEQCSAFGPGKDMFQSCEIIGDNQFKRAVQLSEGPGTPLSNGAKPPAGSVDFVHTYVRMPMLNVSDVATGDHLGRLCKAAMGDSFAAGTIDGPGAFDFTQGANSSNPFWHFIAGLLHKSTPAEIACQEPKGILLPTGSVNVPYPWAPDVIPMQILRVEQLVILVVPTEMTTMAGRRFRTAIKAQLVHAGVVDENAVVVIAGLANDYADYTVTFEEYQQQRYEAASTIFGPHQLSAYIQEFSKLAVAMGTGVQPTPKDRPTDFSDKLFGLRNLSTDHVPDGAKHFGDVMSDVNAQYSRSTESVVNITVAGANPVNNLRHQGTFLEVQRCVDAGTCATWATVAEDGDWETRMHVHKQKKDLVLTTHTFEFNWYIPADAELGEYRMVAYGTSCDDPLIGKEKFTEFEGTSKTFTVVE